MPMALHKESKYNGLQLNNLLDDLTFFDQFDASEKREFVSSENHIIRVDPGTKIVTQGTVDYSLYILLEGEVIVTKTEFPRLVVATLEPGAIFGEISMLSNGPRQSNIIAKDEVKVLKLNAEPLEKLSLPTQFKLNKQFIKVLLNRIEGNNAYLIKLKGELDSITQIGTQFKSNFHEIIKKSTQVDEMFDSINETIVKLIR